MKSKHTEESRLKISRAMKGRVKTEQHRKNHSISMTGKKHSEETKRKISEGKRRRHQLKMMEKENEAKRCERQW